MYLQLPAQNRGYNINFENDNLRKWRLWLWRMYFLTILLLLLLHVQDAPLYVTRRFRDVENLL